MLQDGILQRITCVTKNSLVQGLIIGEVIGKRERQMWAVSNGLEWAGFLALIHQYPEKMHPLFIYCGRELVISSKFSSTHPPPLPNQPI